MIYIGVARNEDGDDKFVDYLKPSLDRLDNQKFQLIEIFNKDADSIFKKYNKIVSDLGNELKDEDVVVFIHADVKILDELFLEKIEYVFQTRERVGIVGVIGTTELETAGWWRNNPSLHRGHVVQGKEGANGKDSFHMIREVGYFEDLVMVDGLMLAVRGSVAKSVKFDELQPKSYNFYDCNFCLDVLEFGNKIAVADILLEHASEGALSPDWFSARSKFIEKWEKKGLNFPVRIQNFGINN